MEPAGIIVSEQPESDQFSVCDGHFVSGARYPDYRHRCGGQAGSAGIGFYRKPVAPGFSIRITDDPNAPDPPADAWSIFNLPPPYQLWINPVADIVADAEGLGLAMAEAHIEPVAEVCTAYVTGPSYTGAAVDFGPEPDGTMALIDGGVPVGDSYRWVVNVKDRPSLTAESNDFQVKAS